MFSNKRWYEKYDGSLNFAESNRKMDYYNNRSQYMFNDGLRVKMDKLANHLDNNSPSYLRLISGAVGGFLGLELVYLANTAVEPNTDLLAEFVKRHNIAIPAVSGLIGVGIGHGICKTIEK